MAYIYRNCDLLPRVMLLVPDVNINTCLTDIAGAMCGKVLRFVLRADMETSDSLVFSAEVELQMMNAPLLGELKARAAYGAQNALNPRGLRLPVLDKSRR